MRCVILIFLVDFVLTSLHVYGNSIDCIYTAMVPRVWLFVSRKLYNFLVVCYMYPMWIEVVMVEEVGGWSV